MVITLRVEEVFLCKMSMVKPVFVFVFDSRRWSKRYGDPGDENGPMDKSSVEYIIRRQESMFPKEIRIELHFTFFGDVMKF